MDDFVRAVVVRNAPYRSLDVAADGVMPPSRERQEMHVVHEFYHAARAGRPAVAICEYTIDGTPVWRNATCK